MSAALRCALSLGIAWWGLPGLLAAEDLRPDPSLGPTDVIRIVVEALQHHNSPIPNAGIFTVYRFASPGNRANAGPYGRFLRLVKRPPFTPLLSGHGIVYGELSAAGDRAGQAVGVRTNQGEVIWFHIVVARQTSEQTQGRCGGCWMVDEVSPMDLKP